MPLTTFWTERSTDLDTPLVFFGVFDYVQMTWYHRHAFNITYAELHTAVLALSTNQNVDSKYDRILALHPVYQGPFESAHWGCELQVGLGCQERDRDTD